MQRRGLSKAHSTERIQAGAFRVHSIFVSAYRYIAITTLAITAVFLVYLRQFLIDLHEIYRHSSVPKTRLPEFFQLLSSRGFRARRRRDFFCHVVSVTVWRIPRLTHTSVIWLN